MSLVCIRCAVGASEGDIIDNPDGRIVIDDGLVICGHCTTTEDRIVDMALAVEDLDQGGPVWHLPTGGRRDHAQ